MRALLGLRDAAHRLLELEATTVDDTDEINAAREGLHRDYRKYVGRYGPLNRYTLRRTGRINDAGEDTYARTVPTPIRLLRSDPFGRRARPGAVRRHRPDCDPGGNHDAPGRLPRTEPRGVDTPADAIAVSLDRTGRIDLPLIADMLGMDEPEARQALGGLIFTDPVTDELIHAPAYLSGDVRMKLEQATTRAADDPAFQTNVDALTEVVPEALGVQEISARMGAVIAPRSRPVPERAAAHQRRERENPLPGMWKCAWGPAVCVHQRWGN